MLRITTLFPTLKKPSSWLFLYGFHLNETNRIPVCPADAVNHSSGNASILGRASMFFVATKKSASFSLQPSTFYLPPSNFLGADSNTPSE
jgi:hypothetical protein